MDNNRREIDIVGKKFDLTGWWNSAFT